MICPFVNVKFVSFQFVKVMICQLSMIEIREIRSICEISAFQFVNVMICRFVNCVMVVMESATAFGVGSPLQSHFL